MPKIRRILMATDFSECSHEALEQASALARAFDASLDVLHVWEVPPFLPGELLVGESGAQASLMDLVCDRANQRMGQLLGSAERDGIRISSGRCVFGVPHSAIVDTASEGQYDLLVLGSRGRTGLTRALLGSVAERVVRHAPCTVVVAREPRVAQA
jgi:universal stress protein A